LGFQHFAAKTGFKLKKKDFSWPLRSPVNGKRDGGSTTKGLRYKTFYDRILFRVVISWIIYHSLSLPP
jgi:hypothetical protein